MNALVKVLLRTIVCAILSIPILATGALAQDYPNRPIRLLVGYAPGGGSDTMTRLLGAKLSEMWGQPVLVENHPGADSAIAAELVANATPDGYTILSLTIGHTLLPFAMKLNYDTLADFAAITPITKQHQFLLARPGLGVKNVQELVNLAKAKPGEVTFSGGGVGRSIPGYMSMERMMQMAGIKLTHVPYKGSGDALKGLLSGEVDLLLGSISSSKALVAEGKILALGITGPERNPDFPDVPTITETVSGFQSTSWYGVVAPAGTPDEIVQKLNADIVTAMNSPDLKEKVIAGGSEVFTLTHEEFTKYLADEVAQWKDVVSNLPPE